jgi:hypothetical protein
MEDNEKSFWVMLGWMIVFVLLMFVLKGMGQ